MRPRRGFLFEDESQSWENMNNKLWLFCRFYLGTLSFSRESLQDIAQGTFDTFPLISDDLGGRDRAEIQFMSL